METKQQRYERIDAEIARLTREKKYWERFQNIMGRFTAPSTKNITNQARSNMGYARRNNKQSGPLYYMNDQMSAADIAFIENAMKTENSDITLQTSYRGRIEEDSFNEFARRAEMKADHLIALGGKIHILELEKNQPLVTETAPTQEVKKKERVTYVAKAHLAYTEQMKDYLRGCPSEVDFFNSELRVFHVSSQAKESFERWEKEQETMQETVQETVATGPSTTVDTLDLTAADNRPPF